MPELIRAGNQLINLDLVKAITFPRTGFSDDLVFEFLAGPSVRLYETGEIAHVRTHLNQHVRCGATREERHAWAGAIILIANELVGGEITAERRRELSLRLIALSDKVSPERMVRSA